MDPLHVFPLNVPSFNNVSLLYAIQKNRVQVVPPQPKKTRTKVTVKLRPRDPPPKKRQKKTKRKTKKVSRIGRRKKVTKWKPL